MESVPFYGPWLTEWRGRTYAAYEPIVGPDAAEQQCRANDMHVYFSMFLALSVLVSVPIGWLGYPTAALAVFWPIFAVACSCILRRLWYGHRRNEEATYALGTVVDIWSPVPITPERHERWCEKRGITPLAKR